jgi:hypothetical protein
MLDGADLVALGDGLSALNLNSSRLHRFRYFSLQFNLEQAVIE